MDSAQPVHGRLYGGDTGRVREGDDVTFSFAVEVARFDDDAVSTGPSPGDVPFRIRWWLGAGPLLVHRFTQQRRDRILLVDRTHAIGLDAGGRPIPGFSVRPSADITAHAVVDYDGKGEERYLFGLADGRLLNHRKLGEATPGWRHGSKGQAIQSVVHLRAGRKDYLCTVDEKGVVMLLKRSGVCGLRPTPRRAGSQGRGL